MTGDDDLGYLREFEHITLGVRVLIARCKREQVDSSLRQAMALLERLREAAEAGERTGSLIEILALHALAHEAQGDVAGALAPLERALTLAQPEGYVRIFVDEGPGHAHPAPPRRRWWHRKLLHPAAARGLQRVRAARAHHGPGRRRSRRAVE